MDFDTILKAIVTLDKPVLIKLVSTALSYGVVFGSVILKVPQILAIIRSNSAEGISLTSVLIETFVYVIAASWGLVNGLEFKDFGENVFILGQLVILVLMVSFHHNKMLQGVLGFAVISTIGWALSFEMVPLAVHSMLLNCQSLIGMASRLPQVYLNYKKKSTGQLSFATFFLAFGGGVARLLTTAVNVKAEQGRNTLLTQFGIAVFLNGVVLTQILMYTGLFKKGGKKDDKKKAAVTNNKKKSA